MSNDRILMGVREVAGYLKLTVQRVRQLWAQHPDFPEAIDVLLTGPVWWAEDIEEFAKIPRPPGRPWWKEKGKEKPQ